MKRGFTLIEGIVTAVLVGIIFWVFAFYIREDFDAWRFTVGQKDMALSSRVAINRIVRELRRDKEIYTHSSREVTFKDVNNDTVTFKQSGSDLLRNSRVLLENLKDPGGLTFIYLDKDGNETAVTDDMRTICCRLTVETDENRFVVESAARIRLKQIK